MSTVLEHITALETAKSEMLEIFQDRGVTVPEGTSLVNFPGYMEQMSYGGIPCALTIKTLPGATVTATLDEVTVTATAGENGEALLILEKEGTWAVKASDGISENSIKVIMDYKLSENIGLVGTLEETPWNLISQVARTGQASAYWNIGDTKTIIMNGFECKVRIIGFDHDDVTDAASYGRNKAGITFDLAGIYDDRPYSNSSSDTWDESNLRSLMTSFYEPLLSVNPGLIDAIVPVNKGFVIDDYPVTMSYTSDRLFVLSAREVSTDSISFTEEGPQYAYYAAGNSYVKKYLNPNIVNYNKAYGWWTRSKPNRISGLYYNYHVSIGYSGAHNNLIVGEGIKSKGISFAFCV